MLIYLQAIVTDEDKSKFEAIYLAYRDLMYRVAFGRLHNEQDAEDAVHHVFVKVAENIRRIEPVSPKTKQFVVTMVHNRVTDVLRARGRHPVTEFREELFPETQEELSGEENLASCILRLPERQRMVIWLKYHYGYGLREIAKMMDVSLAAAQKLDQRAKKKLEALYNDE